MAKSLQSPTEPHTWAVRRLDRLWTALSPNLLFCPTVTQQKMSQSFVALRKDFKTTAILFLFNHHLREAQTTTPQQRGWTQKLDWKWILLWLFCVVKARRRIWSGVQSADCDKHPVVMLSVWAPMLPESSSFCQLHTDALLKSSQLHGHSTDCLWLLH